jgi:coenzyme F420-0:L-glutamate ligase / coenzyme F420-1:gamma-L-glutamate ligase
MAYSSPARAAEIRLIALPDIPLIREGDDLVSIVLKSTAARGERLRSGDILVISQKIISKAEGRVRQLGSVIPSLRAVELAQKTRMDPRLVEVILEETSAVLRHRNDIIIVEHKLGFVMANAGIDQSNVEGAADGQLVLLLPRDPDASCKQIRKEIHARTGTDVGVIVNDSQGRAWRNGTVGVALGVSGLPAVADLRGTLDLFGRELRRTIVGLADEIAAAASLLMGQAAEGQPIVLVRGIPHAPREGTSRELVRAREEDLFR